MLQSISWTDYILVFSAITAVYYAVLAATCYRKDISSRFFRRSYQPKYRTDISIPVVNGVMGSVLFEEADEKLSQAGAYSPAPGTTASGTGHAQQEDYQPATEELPEEGQEEEEPYYDEYGSEAEQAAQWDLMEDLVNRLTKVIDKAPDAVTPEALVEQLRMVPSKGDKEVLAKFRESITNLLMEKAAEKLDIFLSEAALRPLWL